MISKTLILVVALILASVFCVTVDYGSRVGLVLGLLLGFLSGPVRIAGVDFRQWFKDPGPPSELGDDTFVGLARRAFLWLLGIGALALVGLTVTVSAWMPQSCSIVDASPTLGMLPDSMYLRAVGQTLGAFLAACSGPAAGAKLVAGSFLGLVLVQAVVEIAWRFGLVFGLPPPGRPIEYLAARPLPRVRAKQSYRGRRRIIVACDGTWNWPESKRETNVVRLVRSLKPDDNGIAQIIHYHQGVGTGNLLDRIVGGGAGVGLSASVKACYGFLVDNFNEHDEIFLFGFSRGAYVVRALGGLIGQVGIMRKHEMDRFADVWNWYWQDEADRDARVLDRLAPKRHRAVDIECIGVWDTVGALGIPGTRFCAAAFAFHETGLGPHVRHAFQALAIDETRGNFQAAVWVPSDAEKLAGASTQQVLKQVWFPGVHSNVGGGYREHGLSDATFLWMLSELSQHHLLGFDQTCILQALDPDQPECYPGGTMHDSRTLFWKLVGCPVPRPVCVISETERVHESAWERQNADPVMVPQRDIYKGPARRQWLAAMLDAHGHGPPVRLPRSQFETDTAALTRPPLAPAIEIPKKLDWCMWVLQYFSSKS